MKHLEEKLDRVTQDTTRKVTERMSVNLHKEVVVQSATDKIMKYIKEKEKWNIKEKEDKDKRGKTL